MLGRRERASESSSFEIETAPGEIFELPISRRAECAVFIFNGRPKEAERRPRRGNVHVCTRTHIHVPVSQASVTRREIYGFERTVGNGKCVGRAIENPFRRTFDVSVGQSHHISVASSRLYCAATTSKKTAPLYVLVIFRERGKKKYGRAHEATGACGEKYPHLQLCIIGRRATASLRCRLSFGRE